QIPQLGPLFFWIPAILCIAKGKDALLGPRLFLIAARAANGGIEAVFVQRLLERLRFHDVGMHGGSMRKRINTLLHAFRIGVHDKLDAGFPSASIAETDNLLELPLRIHMHDGNGW